MKIAIVGTGYVGLVTAAVFAKFKNDVWGLDVDKNKIRSLRLGQMPFYEPGLAELVKQGLKSKRLHFTFDYKKAIPKAEIIFICVGTPPKKEGDYDLSYVYEASRQIGRFLKNYAVIVIKSTVPPNTGLKVKEIIRKETKIPFDVASCPEFLREGSAVKDCLYPSRIVIGTENKKAQKLLLKIHQPIKAKKVLCDINSAQLIKYAANAFLATKISYINSIAYLCDKIGADINYVSLGLGLDPRIGKSFLNAGLGYGGSCFPKDTWALIAYSHRIGYDFQFLKQVDKINNFQIDYFAEKIKKMLKGVLVLLVKPKTS